MVIPLPAVRIAVNELPGSLEVVETGEDRAKLIVPECSGVKRQWPGLGLQDESVVVLLCARLSSRPMTVERNSSRSLRVRVLMV